MFLAPLYHTQTQNPDWGTCGKTSATVHLRSDLSESIRSLDFRAPICGRALCEFGWSRLGVSVETVGVPPQT